MRSIRRGTWSNHTGNQVIDPLRIYEPRSLDELVAIVREAEADGTTVRAVGSGHRDVHLERTDQLAHGHRAVFADHMVVAGRSIQLAGADVRRAVGQRVAVDVGALGGVAAP